MLVLSRRSQVATPLITAKVGQVAQHVYVQLGHVGFLTASSALFAHFSVLFEQLHFQVSPLLITLLPLHLPQHLFQPHRRTMLRLHMPQFISHSRELQLQFSECFCRRVVGGVVGGELGLLGDREEFGFEVFYLLEFFV